MKVIVHSCSSILIRPNGITRYINTVIDLQRRLGNYVIFVTDAKPTQTINADKILYQSESSSYVPNWKDGHVWLQVSEDVSTQISQSFKSYFDTHGVDLVIAHDLHSYLGLCDIVSDGIFVQHESDVMYHDSRYSFIDDEYLAKQIEVVNTTNWRIGMTAESKYVSPKRPIYTPVPFKPVGNQLVLKTRDLLYIGDATDRKGAKEFMEVARLLGVTPTVITHEPDAELFKGADVYTFTLDQRQEMFELMQECRVAYIPSRNECVGIANLECLQFMPVIVNGNYNWTTALKDVGVIRSYNNEETCNILSLLMLDESYDRVLLDIWSKNGIQFWVNLST